MPEGVTRRMRLPAHSPTNAFSDAGSTATPCGPLNIAAAPCPSAPPAAPLPASVLTFQKQGGCAESSGTGHAVAGEHGARAAPPPAQNEPTVHALTLMGDAEPAGQ